MIHRSSYRYWALRGLQIRPEQIRLQAEVRQAYNESRGSAGARTLAGMVSARGIALSRYRATGLMRRMGLVSCQPRSHRYRKTPQVQLSTPNRLNRQFDAIRPDHLWCSDVTYIWTGRCWSYLAVVMDLFSRKPVGWAISCSPDSKLTCRALSMAWESRGRPKGILFHSDRGSHYTSLDFRQQLAQYHMQQSLSRKGNCWDNAPMERLFRSLKTEWIPPEGYQHIRQAAREITDYLHGYYSQQRPHQYNDGLTPDAAEQKFWIQYKSVASFT